MIWGTSKQKRVDDDSGSGDVPKDCMWAETILECITYDMGIDYGEIYCDHGSGFHKLKSIQPATRWVGSGYQGFLKCQKAGGRNFVLEHLCTDCFLNPDEEVVLQMLNLV